MSTTPDDPEEILPPPQSVAALLPEEILDLVFAQFDFNHSLCARRQDRHERDRHLSNMSVVAEGWKRPARTLLFRTVRVKDPVHLQEKADEWAREEVRELEVNYTQWYVPESAEIATATFDLLKQVPKLRRIRLINPPFASFGTASPSMQSTLLLPHLCDLSIMTLDSPDSIISDLLATSGRQIRRICMHSNPQSTESLASHQQLDFSGNLRYLSTGSRFYQALVDPARMVGEGFEGLEELRMSRVVVGSSKREKDLYQIIAPTLRTLSINADDITGLANFLPLLRRLTRLTIRGPIVNSNPLLRCLPPSLSFLRLANDSFLQFVLDRWTDDPTLVPAGLHHPQIDEINHSYTLEHLPPIDTLTTSDAIDLLARISPGVVRVRAIEMFIPNDRLYRVSLAQEECSRLGLEFRQRTELWRC